MHEFKDVIAKNQIGSKSYQYRRRELYLMFKGKMILHGWCHADHLSGIWEPENPWGTYKENTIQA